MTHENLTYAPGECNIGPEEVARRRNLGWIALGITLAAYAGMKWSAIDVWWRLLIFLPATASASGFLQAYFRFCVGFARMGVFNFGRAGEMHKIDNEDSKKKDRKKGSTITLYAAVIGAVVTILSIAAG